MPDQKKRIFQPPPIHHENSPVSHDGDSHPSSLLKHLLQPDGNKQTSIIQTGKIIRDTYSLELKIGRGGMGQVWKALDLIQDAGEAKDKHVAIKFINHEIKSHPYALKALVREFARYKKLIHPNIVKAYELNRDGNEVFIVMEYLTGNELKEFIRQHPQGIPLTQAQPIIKAMCDALGYAHEEGIIHLDFKPGNVFYSPTTHVCKVIDFGIARLRSQQARDETLFDPGTLGAMTTAYASSEMLMESEPDPRDDVYSLACVVYELLSGHHPFNKCQSLKAEREKMRPQPIPGLSKDEFQALLHGLSFYREQRTDSASEFYSELFSPQLLDKKKHTRQLIIAAIIVTSLAIIPFGLYKAYKNWHLNQVSTNIQQQTDSGIADFMSLSVDEQLELLALPAFHLTLVEYITIKKETQNDALSVIAQFKPIIQQQLFADREVRKHLITDYSQLIAISISQDNFQQAKQLSQRIVQQYPDSMRLAEQSNNIRIQKTTRLRSLQQNYQQCLSDNTIELTELFPCLQQSQVLLAKIDNVVLSSSGLTSRYHRDISSAIKNNKLSYAGTLLTHWYELDQNDISQRNQLAQQLVYAKKRDDLIKQIIESNKLQLTKILSLLPTFPPSLIEGILTHTTVKQRLMGFYQEAITQYLARDNFSAATQTISDGIFLFSINPTEQNKLKQLATKIDQKKTRYLDEQKNLYKAQLSQQEPEVKVIQDIQHNISAIFPDNPLIQLPGLSESYAKKIDKAISQDKYSLAQRLLDSWKLLKPTDVNSREFLQLSDKKDNFLLAFKGRNKASLQLQDAIKSSQLIRLNQLIDELKKHFSKQDQDKIFSPYQDQLISLYQQHIKAAIQKDAFDLANNIATRIQAVFPENEQVLENTGSIAKAKKIRINNLLAESKVAINADILDGIAIFSP
ncbi:MAG: protein kinase, partial [Methyloprofundus sp.]|nr:protein kinase [Methyloprofundus sp.]